MTDKLRSFAFGALAALLGLAPAGCASAAPPPPASPPAAKAAPAPPSPVTETAAPAPAARPKEPPYPSTYRPLPSQPVVITNATILTAAGERIARGAVLLRDGKVAAVGASVEAPAGAVVVDGTGKWVTPGIIDPHSHLGVYAAPSVQANEDGNEATNPNTAEVWAEHSVWPQDPQFPLALAGGVTSMQILPGSANLFGGRSVTVKNVPALGVYGMKFPGAPYGLKMACGENPKRVYGSKGRSPATRMGNVAGYRAAWIKAREYVEKWDRYEAKKKAGKEADEPTRDLQLETLAGVLRGEVLVQDHCYRTYELLAMIDVHGLVGFLVTA